MHAVASLILNITFHTEYPDEFGDIVKILLFTDLSLPISFEVALMASQWGMALERSTLNRYDDTT